MSKPLLKIRISRFEAARAFARDVFIHLPLNGRFIRLFAAGDFMEPEQLNRYSSKGVQDLYVSTDGEEGLDPETYVLYAAGTAPGIPAASSPQAPLPQATADGREESTKISADAPAAEASQTFAPTPAEKETETRIAGSKEEPDTTQTTFKADGPKPEEEALVFSNKAELENEGKLLAARLRGALIGELLSKESGQFRKQVQGTPAKERKKFRRELNAMSEAVTRVAENRADASLAQKYPVDEEMAKFAALGTAESTIELVEQANSRMVQALQSLNSCRTNLKEAERLVTESEAIKESPALARLEKKLAAAVAPPTEEAKLELIEDVKTAIKMDKISQEILKFAASQPEKEEEQRFSPELASLERALETVSAGGDLPEELERRFSADKEAEEMVQVFSSGNDENSKKALEEIKFAADRREKAMEELQNQRTDGSLVRAKSHRDMPATASRLAAYLGYSLGYTNLNFLSDLALTAILHFAKKEEEEVRLSTSEIPPFVARLMGKRENSDFVTEDAREIIEVLDAYIDNPECDREQKDFTKRVFERTIVAMIEDEKKIDAINLAKWMGFVERGADLQGHSVCVKAAANAIKQSRQIII